MQPFKVIWFEDDHQNVDDISPQLEKHLTVHSRLLELQWRDQYSSDFDITMFEGNCSLAIIDLNLKDNDKGTDLIRIIREHGAFIEILLYSNNPKELIELTESKNYIEGIYRHATLTGLEQKIKDVIDLSLYREMMAIERLRLYNESLKG